MGKIILKVILVVAFVAGLYVQKPEGVKIAPQIQPAEELKLSDFPDAFKDSTLIIVGDNASEIERQAAEEIKNFLLKHDSSYIKIIDLQNIENFKKDITLSLSAQGFGDFAKSLG